MLQKLKKPIALLSAALMLAQGVAGFAPVGNEAKAATYDPAMQEIMSRPYPRIMGNQWHINSTGTLTAGNHDAKMKFAAKNLDFIAFNNSSDLFNDFSASIHDPSKALLKIKNDVYSRASALNRKVYVLVYHNMTDVWSYQSIKANPSQNFWMKPDGQNIGTWDYMDKYNHWLRNRDGSLVTYSGYSSSQRRFWDPRKVAVQDYWAKHAKGVTDAGFDGIFADNWLRSGFGDVDTAAVMAGWNTAGQKFKDIAPNKILIGNGPPAAAFTSRDVCMLEDRIAPAGSGDQSIPSYLKYSDTAASQNQVLQDTYWDESKGPFETFRLPMVLLTDNVLGVSTVTKQGSAIEGSIGQAIEKLGKIGFPKGSRVLENGVWRRDYDKARVLVNSTSGSKYVDLPDNVYKDLNGNTVNSVTLAGYRGIVLKTAGTVTTPTTPPTPTPTAPVAPSTLSVTGVAKGAESGSYYVNLTWKDNSTNETGFEIQHSTNATSGFSTIKTAATNATGYGVNLGTNPADGKHYFRVIAFNSSGKSAPSNTAEATISNPKAPAAPANLTGSIKDNKIVTFNWQDNSSNETGFELLQAISSTTFTKVKDIASNVVTTTVDLGTTPKAGTYSYKLVAVNSAGKSPESNVASVNVVAPAPATPTAPSTLSVTGVAKGAESGSYYVNLTWKDNSTNETGFEIQHSTNATSGFSTIKTAGANATGYGVNLGTSPASGSHYFKIVAFNTSGKSAASNTATATIASPAPTSPSSLAVTGVTKGSSTGNYFVNLTWRDNSSNETSFEIQESVGSTSSFKTIKTAATNATGYNINIGSNPVKGTRYYRIIAVGQSAKSAPSNTASAYIR